MNVSLMRAFFSSGQNQTSTDLFGNLSSSLSDYALIRSGSYGKLMRSYYGNVVDSEKASSKTEQKEKTTNEKLLEQLNLSTATESTKALAETKSDAKALESAAENLQDTKLYEQKSITGTDGTKQQGYDMEGLYQKVNAFVKNYNETLVDAKESTTSIIQVVGKSMQTQTQIKQDDLEKIGISIDSSNKLKLDADVFKKADIEDVKRLFQGNSSYGSTIRSLASNMASNASYEASKANTYTTTGKYSYNYTEGTLYQSSI